MQELAAQRNQQQILLDQLVEQKRMADAHERGLTAATESSRIQAAAFEEMKRRTSARWNALTSAPPPAVPPATVSVAGAQVIYGFQEAPKAPMFSGSTKVQKKNS